MFDLVCMMKMTMKNWNDHGYFWLSIWIMKRLLKMVMIIRIEMMAMFGPVSMMHITMMMFGLVYMMMTMMIMKMMRMRIMMMMMLGLVCMMGVFASLVWAIPRAGCQRPHICHHHHHIHHHHHHHLHNHHHRLHNHHHPHYHHYHYFNHQKHNEKNITHAQYNFNIVSSEHMKLWHLQDWIRRVIVCLMNDWTNAKFDKLKFSFKLKASISSFLNYVCKTEPG